MDVPYPTAMLEAMGGYDVETHGQSAPLAGLSLAPCASSGRARWLWGEKP